MDTIDTAPAISPISAPVGGMTPETVAMLKAAQTQRELQREAMDMALRGTRGQDRRPESGRMLDQKTISQSQRLSTTSGIRRLNAHEARLLVFIAYATQKNVDRGATIEEIDAYMNEVPAHELVERLDNMLLTFPPLSRVSRINGMAVEMTRNRRVTDVGMELARQYDDGQMTAEAPPEGPRSVRLAGDADPATPEFRAPPVAVDTDSRPAPTAESSPNIVVSAKPAGSIPEAPKRRG